MSSLTRWAQTSGNGKLEFDEFKVFWDKLKTWIVRTWPAHASGGSDKPRTEGALKGPSAASWRICLERAKWGCHGGILDLTSGAYGGPGPSTASGPLGRLGGISGPLPPSPTPVLVVPQLRLSVSSWSPRPWLSSHRTFSGSLMSTNPAPCLPTSCGPR